MAYPARLLGEGEHIEYETRPHWRVLLVPLVAFLLIVAISGFLFGKLNDNSSTNNAMRWIVFLIAMSAFSYWVIRPIIFWATTLYVFTNRRIITRTGFIARRGEDMPLSRVNNVGFSFSVIERAFNCGTLRIDSASDTPLEILNVPDVEHLQSQINRLHEADDLRRRQERNGSSGDHGGGPLPSDGT